ncbi:MAG: hypothetical protein MUE30_05275, partial [Spirosomaceae bacterium]|nr:hypothetical protein [Spirosomataceae bacterium]
EAKIMLELVKKMARAEGELSENSLIENLESDSKIIEEALNSLVTDQYLRFVYTEGERRYSFKYQLIKKWWKINKA